MLKRVASDLAILGGAAAFSAPVHVGRPNLPDRARFISAVDDMLDRRWLSNNGVYVQRLERRIEEFLGVRHCIAMANGTIGLEIAARALELAGEVIVPSYTFIATAHALRWLGLTPVFADVDPATHVLDPACVEAAITPRTSAILGVHTWGNACSPEALADIAQRRGLKLFFDSAHAFACSHAGRMIGGFGDAEVFSFHATKFFHTFEGGAITTNDDDLAKRVRLAKNFGFSGYDQVSGLGVNGKMSEVHAAMGLCLFERLSELLEMNSANHAAYAAALSGIPGIRLLGFPACEPRNYQYVVLEIDPAVAGITRDTLVRVLWAEDVRARRYFFPGCHRSEPYRSDGISYHLPSTEHLCRDVLVLPSGSAVSSDDIRTVASIVEVAIKNASDLPLSP